ncbi:hypothetical protein FOCG_17953 [Fusarium oxysporum f. sp. radicis-lycopersici 26381]|nr:hypothetical protein FOWG_16955 [Fusarium oxysporum f. sp. lycopersici MN25]EXL39433.1 hypothetical protein FOCG_17953 [Fusarium oxysporum f. sp. radicis-lycopersici 26381]
MLSTLDGHRQPENNQNFAGIRLKSHGKIWSDTNPGQPDRRLSSKVRNTSLIQKLHAYGKYR